MARQRRPGVLVGGGDDAVLAPIADGGMQEVWRCTRSRALWARRGGSTWKGRVGAPRRLLKVRSVERCRRRQGGGRI